jgi:DNA-binding NtrC family response regulator
VQTADAAVAEIDGAKQFHLILIEYSLADAGGVALAQTLREKSVRVPIIFLGSQMGLSMAVEVMRVGGRDFLSKDEIDDHVFPQTLQTHHERHVLQSGVEELEIRRGRLEAMQEMVVNVSKLISDPLYSMQSSLSVLETMKKEAEPEKVQKYIVLIRENLDRLSDKLERLKNLQNDKTVSYIKNIRMIDLS